MTRPTCKGELGPLSCDTFVCLPPNTFRDFVIFGKNSDRPQGEVQEIVCKARESHNPGEKVQCTYIEIEQARETHAVVLSKPSWMWGAEMGANELGVVIGNEAVWTKLNDGKDDLIKRLLGMDLLRLGLERGKSAEDALDVMVSLLEKYGQGGPCSDSMGNWSYHNSFLIADGREAWVLETAGQLWAAEKVEGYRNISNALSIGTRIDKMSADLKEKAKKLRLWNGKEPFNFSRVFSDDFGDSERYLEGKKLLGKYSESKNFDAKSMMKILRDEPSGICRDCDDAFPSTSSQVSVLTQSSSRPHCHWFTGTPDPSYSLFKPFIFCGQDSLTNDTKSSESDHKDRRHTLYKAQQRFFRKLEHPSNSELRKKFSHLENSSIQNVEKLIDSVESRPGQLEIFEKIFDEAVAAEISFYESN